MKEAKKAAAIKEKTKKARQLFNFLDSEEVIQGRYIVFSTLVYLRNYTFYRTDYTCIWGVGKGRMYITQNYIGWASDITSFVVNKRALSSHNE